MIARDSRLRGAKDASDELVVQIRGSERQLRLLERADAMLVPGRLLEHGEGKRMRLEQASVRFFRPAKVRDEVLTKQSGQELHRPERPDPAEDLSSIVSSHPDRGNLPSTLVGVEVWGTAHVRATIAEIHGPLGVLRKAREEVLANPDDLVGLSALVGHTPCHDDV